MSDFILRNAEERDLPALKSLTLELRGLAEIETPFEADFQKVFFLCIDDPTCHIIVAEGGAQILGYLTLWLRPSLSHAGLSALIDELVIAEGARGQGMGRALLEETLKRAQGAGCVEIEVSTGFDNEPAQSLYRSQGFEERGLLLERDTP
ncbi:MAG: GNAT family N-acetyltransferase [Anaerolineae bacterium]